MFEKYMIVETEVQNTVVDSQPTGFQFGARLPYYRGVSLSLIEDIGVSIDGEAVPREDLRLTLHGHTYTLAELEAEADDRWEMGEVGYISFSRPGGLAAGDHLLQLMVHLRISYMPFPSVRRDEKTITLTAQAHGAVA